MYLYFSKIINLSLDHSGAKVSEHINELCNVCIIVFILNFSVLAINVLVSQQYESVN